MNKNFKFKLITQDNHARLGKLTTAHGDIDTPIFMPVGTAASVKAMHLRDVDAAGAQIILANTYHLMLRPGQENIRKDGRSKEIYGVEQASFNRFWWFSNHEFR